jgi:glycosyltransferase involved in cell wall biosynthesis
MGIVMIGRRIGIVTFPLSKQSIIPLSNLAGISNCIGKEVYIITGNAGATIVPEFNKIHFKLINHVIGTNIVTRIFNYVKTQLLVTFNLLKLSKNVDLWIFPNGGEVLILCVIIARIQRKPVIMILTESFESISKYHHDPLFNIENSLIKFNCRYATKLILYSPSLISEWHLDNYREKIIIAHRHYLDFETFKVITPLHKRLPIIGYIGRLSREKGILNLAHALPSIFNEKQDLKVLIGGDGKLETEIKSVLRQSGIVSHIEFLGWISREDLPKYLNQLSLLILPSYIFEGLPNIILEAMACGTPVLATPVGAIPDVIIDGKTGFIMENNSPNCIVDNVIRALNSPDLERIAEMGKQFVEEEYTFEKTVDKWREIIYEI